VAVRRRHVVHHCMRRRRCTWRKRRRRGVRQQSQCWVWALMPGSAWRTPGPQSPPVPVP
jgi:hypothetical protein